MQHFDYLIDFDQRNAYVIDDERAHLYRCDVTKIYYQAPEDCPHLYHLSA